MAIAVQSVSTTAIAQGDPITITKPTGTVDNDLLIAIIVVLSGASNVIDSEPTGWTKAHGSTGGTHYRAIYTKIASSEGSSWNWGFTADKFAAGVCLRVDGHKTSSFFDQVATASATNTSTPSWANTITPSVAESLLVMVISAQQEEGSPPAASAYAIATNDPTWTERADLSDSTNDYLVAVATAVRTQTSATGNSSATLASATADSDCTIFSILQDPNVTVTPAVLDLTLSIQAPVVTGTAVVTPDPVDLTLSIQAPTVSTPAADWTNPDKSSTSTFTNPDKS